MVKVFFFLPKKNLARKCKGCKPIDVDYYTSRGFEPGTCWHKTSQVPNNIDNNWLG
jgi:hypothetical protein